MNRKIIFIYVNGIMTMPGKSENWNGKAVTWTHINTPYHAEKIEYFVGPISRVLGQKKRSQKLKKTMLFYLKKGWNVCLVGHSNGCDVIMDTLRSYDDAEMTIVREQIVGIHLIAAAAQNDFNKNGLNRVNVPVFVYIGGKDWPLVLSSSAGRAIGYGSLGKNGPKNSTVETTVHIEENFSHGDWFADENLDETFSHVMRSV
jgi:hypothetical protein